MKILLTGATGSVGKQLRPILAKQYKHIVLNARSEIKALRKNESFIQGDICNPALWDKLMQNINGVIHMAGVVGPDFTFEETLEPNFVAVYHMFETAKKYGIQKIIYASTHHAIGYIERGTKVDHNTPPRADSWYGLTKACGEIVAAHAADKYEMDVMCIRIGFTDELIPDERRTHTFCSAKDLAQLIKIGLTGPQKGFHQVYGISKCPQPMFDNTHAESLGYTPQDFSLNHLADPSLAKAKPDPNNPEHKYIGGHFAGRGER